MKGAKSGQKQPTLYRADVLIIASKESPPPSSYSQHLRGLAALLAALPTGGWFLRQLPSG